MAIAALSWVRQNPLKLAGVCNITGDFFIGLAGGYEHDPLLTLAGCFGLTGNLILICFGKGGQAATTGMAPLPVPAWRKYIMFWLFPIEAAFTQVMLAALCYIASGLNLLGRYPHMQVSILLIGLSVLVASLLAIYWPKRPGWPRPLQMAGIIFTGATVSIWWAAFALWSLPLAIAALLFTTSNIATFVAREHDNRKL